MAETDLTGAWGILGGSFDPIHFGHLQLARDSCRIKHLKRVLLSPSYRPPHKEGTRASFEDRVTMIELAIADYPELDVTTIEQELSGSGYTLRLVRELKKRYPERRWVFVIGADNIQDMRTWHKPREIFRETTVIAGARPGFKLDTSGLPEWFDIEMVETGECDVSGTQLRAKLSRGMSVTELNEYVPGRVADYIEKHHLYRS